MLGSLGRGGRFCAGIIIESMRPAIVRKSVFLCPGIVNYTITTAKIKQIFAIFAKCVL
jgi:hypothetical protein